jgi:hypothetical protein
MKARITFYFAAIVALVLFLACVPSHATERRDPLIIQDTPTTQAARSSNMVRSTVSAKPEQRDAHKAKSTGSEKSHASNAPAAVKPSETSKDGATQSDGSAHGRSSR